MRGSRARICCHSPSYDLIEPRVLLAPFFSSNIRGGKGRRENQSESRRLFHMNLKRSSNSRDFRQTLPFCTYFQTGVFLLFLSYTWPSFFGYNLVYLSVCFYLWPGRVFIAARPFWSQSGGLLSASGVRASHAWLLSLPTTGSGHLGFSICGSWTQDCVSRAPEHRLRSCGAQA